MINNETPFIYQKMSDYTKAAGFLAKCVMFAGVIDLVARSVFGMDGIAISAIGATIGFTAWVILDGVANQIRSYAVVAHHSLMGNQGRYSHNNIDMTKILLLT